jgi:hypothetical protein
LVERANLSENVVDFAWEELVLPGPNPSGLVLLKTAFFLVVGLARACARGGGLGESEHGVGGALEILGDVEPVDAGCCLVEGLFPRFPMAGCAIGEVNGRFDTPTSCLRGAQDPPAEHGLVTSCGEDLTVEGALDGTIGVDLKGIEYIDGRHTAVLRFVARLPPGSVHALPSPSPSPPSLQAGFGTRSSGPPLVGAAPLVQFLRTNMGNAAVILFDDHVRAFVFSRRGTWVEHGLHRLGPQTVDDT